MFRNSNVQWVVAPAHMLRRFGGSKVGSEERPRTVIYNRVGVGGDRDTI